MSSSIRVGRCVRPSASTRPSRPGNREPVHVGVDETDAQPPRGERDGEIGGERRLADAALAARHGDHPRERVRAERHHARRAAIAEEFGQLAPLVGRHDTDVEVDADDAGDGGRGIRHLPRDALGCRAARDREGDPHRGDVAVDRDLTEHAEVGERAAQLRIDHGPDSGADRGGGIRHRASDSTVSPDVAPFVELLEEHLELRAQHVARDDLVREVGDGHAQGDDLAGEVLGVGEVALGALAVLLDLHAVAVVLAVLREEDEGGRVRRLQREDERQQREVRRARVELQRHGCERVPREPHHARRSSCR